MLVSYCVVSYCVSSYCIVDDNKNCDCKQLHEECDYTFILLRVNFKFVILFNQNYNLKFFKFTFHKFERKRVLVTPGSPVVGLYKNKKYYFYITFNVIYIFILIMLFGRFRNLTSFHRSVCSFCHPKYYN